MHIYHEWQFGFLKLEMGLLACHNDRRNAAAIGSNKWNRGHSCLSRLDFSTETPSLKYRAFSRVFIIRNISILRRFRQHEIS